MICRIQNERKVGAFFKSRRKLRVVQASILYRPFAAILRKVGNRIWIGKIVFIKNILRLGHIQIRNRNFYHIRHRNLDRGRQQRLNRRRSYVRLIIRQRLPRRKMIADFANRRNLQIIKSNHIQIGQTAIHNARTKSKRAKRPFIVDFSMPPKLGAAVLVRHRICNAGSLSHHVQMQICAGIKNRIADLKITSPACDRVCTPQRRFFTIIACKRKITIESIIRRSNILRNITAEQHTCLRLHIQHIHIYDVIRQIHNRGIFRIQNDTVFFSQLQFAKTSQHQLPVYNAPLAAALRKIFKRRQIGKIIFIIKVFRRARNRYHRHRENQNTKSRDDNFFHKYYPPKIMIYNYNILQIYGEVNIYFSAICAKNTTFLQDQPRLGLNI